MVSSLCCVDWTLIDDVYVERFDYEEVRKEKSEAKEVMEKVAQ